MSITRRNTQKSVRKPLPPRLSGLLREIGWLLSVALAAFLAVILFSYSQSDPGWSHSGQGSVHNVGGTLGSYLADILLSLFGLSTWWLVALALYATWWGYRKLEISEASDRRSLYIRSAGFVLLLLSSAGLESQRLYSLHIALPEHPGGILGAIAGEAVVRILGFTGGTLALLVLIAASLSLFTNISWLTVVEKTGEYLERSWFWAIETWTARRERRVGQAATLRRDEMVMEEKRRNVDRAPVIIETPPPTIIKSERVQVEKQAPLFAEMPDSPLPPLHLLDAATAHVESLSAETLEFTSRLIERKLAEFNVQARVVAALPGPVITRYEIEPASGVKGSQIVNLAKDLARALSVVSIRVVETIPGKTTMALEIPNPKREIVRLSEILSAKVYHDMASPLAMAMGKDIAGNPVVADLAKMPHVLVAGTTGSGKSVAINAMILSLLYKADPSQVRLILVDPKMLELSVYEGIPHLLAPVVTDMRQAAAALNWCVAEMERRYKLMSTLGVRNLAGYNQKVRDAKKSGTPLTHPFSLTPDNPEPLEEQPMIVVVIDELADMMMVVGKAVEQLIARLAQKARAAGVHLILATQRPSVDVITGLIKANIPTRVAFQVSSKIDSRTILDQMGAEALLGQGDMLYLPPGTGYPQRVHGAFVADEEVHKVVEYLKQLGEPDYIEGILDTPEDNEVGGETAVGGGDAESDPLYDEAVALVLKTKRPSISAVQRHLRIGYNRAARLIEAMEQAGLVTPMQSNGNREVLAQNRE
ncbi:DNA translocase FtsK [Sulfuriferula sp. GW1]|uniref:DNA translocase FtsK n=1 Tax=Sulfuriferula sp. GW1 TaxID=3345111 RepID=UPI0039B0AB6A